MENGSGKAIKDNGAWFALHLQRLAKKETQGAAEETLAVFTDKDHIANRCREAMAWDVESGIMTGYNGSIMPNGALTRAQAATMLVRYTEL